MRKTKGKIPPLTIRSFRANQIAEAVIKVTMGYRLEVAMLLKGKLRDIRVVTLAHAWEFRYFTEHC